MEAVLISFAVIPMQQVSCWWPAKIMNVQADGGVFSSASNEPDAFILRVNRNTPTFSPKYGEVYIGAVVGRTPDGKPLVVVRE